MVTNLERVKFRAQITEDGTGFDDTLKHYIFAVSGFIEDYLGRKLKEDTYLQTFTGVVDKEFTLHNVPLKSITYARRIDNKTKKTAKEYVEGIDFYLYPAQDTGKIVFNENVNATAPYSLQVSYVGGYVVDFSKPSEHNLPPVITDVAEQLVIGMHNKRKSAGIRTSDFQSSEIEYEDIFKDWHREQLAPYKRAKPFAL